MNSVQQNLKKKENNNIIIMKNLKDFIVNINEKMAKTDEIDFNSPVMFSIYGNSEGPWYFGYRLLNDPENGVVGSNSKETQVSYAKLVVPFDQFDPKNLKNNESKNLIK